ncbi:MAG TPA: DoxX family protein [Candidatus Polarisedimenticolaceae bacterium]
MKRRLFDPGSHTGPASLGLLLLRLGFGLSMALGHGWGKLRSFGELAATFPDPLGIGSRLSLMGAIGGEFVCPLLLALGLGTRLAAIPAAFTMGVAVFVIHAADPFAKQEKALLFLVAFAALVFTGAGRYSLDAKLGK